MTAVVVRGDARRLLLSQDHAELFIATEIIGASADLVTEVRTVLP